MEKCFIDLAINTKEIELDRNFGRFVLFHQIMVYASKIIVTKDKIQKREREQAYPNGTNKEKVATCTSQHSRYSFLF